MRVVPVAAEEPDHGLGRAEPLAALARARSLQAQSCDVEEAEDDFAYPPIERVGRRTICRNDKYTKSSKPPLLRPVAIFMAQLYKSSAS